MTADDYGLGAVRKPRIARVFWLRVARHAGARAGDARATSASLASVVRTALCRAHYLAWSALAVALISIAQEEASLPPALASPVSLEASRARWRSAGLVNYEYGYHKYCDCHRESPPETVVTVRDGNVVGVRHRPVGSTLEVAAEPRNLQYYWTVDELFALLESALDRGVEVRAAYDADLGYPSALYIDYDSALIGDELDLRLTRVEPAAR